jgi:23S rRNA (cytosine1962-C5)-methyltransferase
VHVLGVTTLCRLTGFRHLGIFPEQLPHWQWMLQWLQELRGTPRVLNLFAYTGAASLIAARARAEVTHVDASKKAIAWAKENQVASKLTDAPIRWIIEDARKFVAARSRSRSRIHPGRSNWLGRGPEGEAGRFRIWLCCTTAKLLARPRSALVSPLTPSGRRRWRWTARCRPAGRPGSIESAVTCRRAVGRATSPTSMFTRWSSHEGAP